MTTLTQQSLRVYAALSGLRHGQGDVLDALVPFFEPILQGMHDKIYDPPVFAKAVQRLYGWRFTKDIAEAFIPRFVKFGYLKRSGTLLSAIYVVSYIQKAMADAQEDHSVAEFLPRITAEFVTFSSDLTDLVHVETAQDRLQDILIRFLVSLNAYSDTAMREQIEEISVEDPVSSVLVGLDEGSRALSPHERYQCARFVKFIYEKKPTLIPFLSRVASIGLLTEVVEDFAKPSSIATAANLDIILDAPLALDYIGTSGKAIAEDIRNILDALKAIGCRLIVLPQSCEEMTRVLSAMLFASKSERRGRTWDAIRRREITEDFVIGVRGDPETTLREFGVSVRSIDLTSYPNAHRYFSKAHFEHFMSLITWVPELPAREHDATCLALTMRLREGQKSADLFKCRYVFLTVNPKFANDARKFCVQNRMIGDNQCGPVVDQRELAMLAWLRTGLGAQANIPRSHLLATCEAVLRIRTEVMKEVYAKLKEVTPERLPEFEVLVSNHRSVERLMDQTLADPRVVTAENAVALLEAMEEATQERLEEKHTQQLEEIRGQHQATLDQIQGQNKAELDRQRLEFEEQQKVQAKTLEEAARFGAVQSDRLSALERREKEVQLKAQAKFHGILDRTNKRTQVLDRCITGLLAVLVLFGIGAFFYHPLADFAAWHVILVLVAAAELYLLVQHLRQKPIFGVGNILNGFSRWQIARGVRNRGLEDVRDQYDCRWEYGCVSAVKRVSVSANIEETALAIEDRGALRASAT